MLVIKEMEKILAKYYSLNSTTYKILVAHGQAVAAKALQIADRNSDKNIDREFIYQAAILHDIGICKVNAPKIGCFGQLRYIYHGIEGRKILEAENLPRHALVCERHVGLGLEQRVFSDKSYPVPAHDMKPQTLEEKIICLADKFFSKGQPDEKTFQQVVENQMKHDTNSINKLIKLCSSLNYPIPFKQLNFAAPLPELILSGQKTTTWRIADEKNLQAGDLVNFCHDSKIFATAIVHQTYHTSFGQLSPIDWEGHEKFKNNSEMYQTYQKYYNQPINEKTELKVIKFYLL